MRRGVLVVVLALAAAACVRGAGPETAGQAPGRTELRVGFMDDQYVLEGPEARLGMYPLNVNAVETLDFLTPNYEVKPLLAEKWELVPPNTWRFTLRSGVGFHDGTPLKAEAVAFMFERQSKRRGGGTVKAGPGSVKVVDDLTVEFTPTVPNVRVPQQIVHPSNGVVAPGSDPGTKPVGTGAFRFVEYRQKELISVERNPDYWGPKPKLERITFRFYPDANARVLALQSGDVDLIFNVNRPDVKGLRDKGFRVVTSTVGAYRAIYLNSRGKPPHDILQDVLVRKAVAHSIDRKRYVDGVLDGLATTDPTMVPPSSMGTHASMVKGYAHDPARARALLDQAGWRPGTDGIREKDGRKLKLTIVSGFPSAETHRPGPAFIQSQLKEVGIDSEIVERPDSASYQALIDAGQGDLYLEEGSQNDADPGFLPTLLFYTGGGGSSAPYQSLFAPGAKFDQVLAPSRSEADIAKVQKSVAEAMHELVDEYVGIVPLAGIYRVYATSADVRGFTPHPSFLNTRWESVSLAR